MDSCSSCPAGHYCSTEGLDKPTGPCAAGFYCPFDFSSMTPYGFLCPKVKVGSVCSSSLYILFFFHSVDTFTFPQGSLLSRELCLGLTLPHRRVPTQPRLRLVYTLSSWILLRGGHSWGTMALPTSLVLPCRYI